MPPAATFNALANTYRYDNAALDARIEETKETPDWKRERITFNGAGGARVIGYLYLPNHVARPLQVLHYYPAGDVNGGFRSLTDSMDEGMAPFIKSGRANSASCSRGTSSGFDPWARRPSIRPLSNFTSEW